MSLRSRSGRVRTAAALLAAGLPGSVAVAPSAAAPADFVVSEAWIRVTIPSRPAAGYFKLTNNTDADARLVGAASLGCAAMMLHETVDEEAGPSRCARSTKSRFPLTAGHALRQAVTI